MHWYLKRGDYLCKFQQQYLYFISSTNKWEESWKRPFCYLSASKQHILLPLHMAILWCFVIALNMNTRTWSSSHLLGMRSPMSYLTLLNSISFTHKRDKIWWDRENLLGIVEYNPNTEIVSTYDISVFIVCHWDETQHKQRWTKLDTKWGW